jgi:hypothetical protein
MIYIDMTLHDMISFIRPEEIRFINRIRKKNSNFYISHTGLVFSQTRVEFFF